MGSKENSGKRAYMVGMRKLFLKNQFLMCGPGIFELGEEWMIQVFLPLWGQLIDLDEVSNMPAKNYDEIYRRL